ncbi:hypothetical protein L7F22_014676 [Adiantum nelumboides]|nr:hypothetical protein [Adiantum nelumboides]
MQKLFNLCMQESASVASHINEFDSLFVQTHAQRMNMDDEMKAIFFLCSLPPSWDIFCTVISSSASNGILVYNDVTSSFLPEEMRQKSMDSLHHGKAHYVQRDDEKQRKGCAKQCDASKDGKRDSSCGASEETLMLVNYLITRLQQAMANPALQGEVQQQLQAYGFIPLHQEERIP